MSVVFINNTQETFTPTCSGAIATHVWEVCRAARADRGAEPWVVTRSCDAAANPWAPTVLLDHPPVPAGRAGVLLCRAQRKMNGWAHLRQKAFAARVAAALARNGLHRLPLVLHNDPELTVYLRDRFPDAFIAHHFHNHLECKPGFRRRFAAAADAVSAVSGFTAGWVARYYAIEPQRVLTIHNGVDAGRFRPAASRPDPRPPVISFVGRTGVEKAPDLLLRAALRLAGRTRAFGLQLVGSNHWGRFEMDGYQRELCGLADELERLGIHVRRPGFVGRADIPGEFRKAHVHVVPSRWDEPCALTVLEGMACGLATVASATGGTPELVGDAGLLFARDSVPELSDRLAELVCDPGRREAYARAARERARRFTWGMTWAGFERLTRGTSARPGGARFAAGRAAPVPAGAGG